MMSWLAVTEQAVSSVKLDSVRRESGEPPQEWIQTGKAAWGGDGMSSLYQSLVHQQDGDVDAPVDQNRVKYGVT